MKCQVCIPVMVNSIDQPGYGMVLLDVFTQSMEL